MKSLHVSYQIPGTQNFSIEKDQLSFSIQNTITSIILTRSLQYTQHSILKLPNGSCAPEKELAIFS